MEAVLDLPTVALCHVKSPFGFSLVHPTGGKVVASNPSAIGMVPVAVYVVVEEAVLLASWVSATPFGREVLTEIVLFPGVKVMLGSVTLMLEPEERFPVHANGA